MNYETIKGLLDEFLQIHYNGSNQKCCIRKNTFT